MSLSYSPVRDAHGRVVALSTIGRDITERKEMEQMKDEMISAVSHEMRTPLTAMLGYTEFMLNNEVPPDPKATSDHPA
jgi:signal transduction histidine kinase